MIIQQARTGRKWGDKKPETTGTARVGSATVAWREFDHWSGPIEAGDTGEFIRATEITRIGRIQWP